MEQQAEVRQRRGPAIQTLYSQQDQSEDVQVKPLHLEKKKEGSQNISQIRDVARGMFDLMSDEHNVITEEGIETAIQSLADKSMNPTKSLSRAQNYVAISESIKSTVRKLLKDSIHSTNKNEVRHI